MGTLAGEVKRVSGMSLVLSVLLIIFGLLAIALPLASSIGIAIVVGWLAIFAGITQVVHAFQSKGIGHIVWKLAVAVFYLAAGAYLLAFPALGVAGLTLVLGIFLFAEGVADVIAYFAARKSGASAWVLRSACPTAPPRSSSTACPAWPRRAGAERSATARSGPCWSASAP